MALENTWSYLHALGRSVIKPFISTQPSGTILTEGKLSPSEFVEAGDQLIFHYPSWCWRSANQSNMDKSLPQNKQYLELANVGCRTRANVPEQLSENEPNAAAENDADDPDLVVVSVKENTSVGAESRLYQISITYDTGYATPRLWLSGYLVSTFRPLTQYEIAEDISSEHAAKTITVLPHPFLNIPTVSIHPCRHAETMCKYISELNNQLKEQISSTDLVLSPSIYLIIFLSMLSSAIPTIEYDGGRSIIPHNLMES